jgi:hypothetical protein
VIFALKNSYGIALVVVTIHWKHVLTYRNSQGHLKARTWNSCFGNSAQTSRAEDMSQIPG